MFETCYLHIGFERTGTTSIQRFLCRNRTELEKRGLYRPLSLGKPNNTMVYLYAAEEDRINDAHRIGRGGLSSEQFRKKIESDLLEELSGRHGTLVVSNEHLHSEVRSIEAIARVRDLLSPHCHRIAVVAYLRRQDRAAISLCTSAIKSGMTYFPETFLGVENGIDYYYDYGAILDNYSSVFGRENMMVQTYEKEYLISHNVVLDFAHVIGVSDFSWMEWPLETNKSLRPLALQFLSEANRFIPVIVGDRANPVRERLIAALEQHYAGSGPVVLRSRALAFYNAFAQTNEQVRNKYFPDRPVLFSEDFSMYPETIDELTQPKFEDAVRIAAILWASVG